MIHIAQANTATTTRRRRSITKTVPRPPINILFSPMIKQKLMMTMIMKKKEEKKRTTEIQRRRPSCHPLIDCLIQTLIPERESCRLEIPETESNTFPEPCLLVRNTVGFADGLDMRTDGSEIVSWELGEEMMFDLQLQPSMDPTHTDRAAAKSRKGKKRKEKEKKKQTQR